MFKIHEYGLYIRHRGITVLKCSNSFVVYRRLFWFFFYLNLFKKIPLLIIWHNILDPTHPSLTPNTSPSQPHAFGSGCGNGNNGGRLLNPKLNGLVGSF